MPFARQCEIARLESLTRQRPKSADAQGRTVRHLGSKIKGAVHAGVLPTHRSGPWGTRGQIANAVHSKR